MYRLVKFPSLKINHSKVLTTQFPTKLCSLCGSNNTKLNPNLKTDNGKSNMLCTRKHSVKTEIALSLKEIARRRKFRKDKKYFTDLLQVFTNEAKEKKLPVTNVRAVDFPEFANTPHLQYNHKVKKKVKKKVKEDENKFSDLTVLNGMEEIILQELNNDLDLNKSKVTGVSETFGKTYNFPSDACLNTSLSRQMCTNSQDFWEREEGSNFNELYALNSVQSGLHTNVLNCPPVDLNLQEDLTEEYEQQDELTNELSMTTTKKALKNVISNQAEDLKRNTLSRVTKEKLAKQKMADLEKMSKERAFNTTLLAYIKLCVSCNFLQRGVATLHYYTYRSKMSANNPKVTDVKIFEVLVQSYSAKGNQNKIDEIWKLLTSCGLQPSLDMLACLLECAARSHKDRHRIPEAIKSLKAKGYELNDIFIQCTFIGDQRERILNAIQEVEPDFKPVVPPPTICYSCSLLQEMNDQAKNSKIKSPVENVIKKSDLRKLSEEQFNNELAFYIKVKSIEKRIEPEATLKINRQKLESMKTLWIKDLKSSFNRDVAILEQLQRSFSISLLPYLRVFSPQTYVDIMMKEVQRLAEGSETFSPSTIQLYRNLGNEVRNRYIVKNKKAHGVIDKTKVLYDKYCDWYVNPSLNNSRSCNGRQEWQNLLHKYQNGPTIRGDDDYWPTTVLVGIGKFLFNIIIGDVKVDGNIFNKIQKEHMLPAFYRVYRQQGLKSVEEIKPHPVISKLFRAAGEEHITFNISMIPMVSPPMPWVTYQSGGYLMTKMDIIRLPDEALQQRQRLKEAPPEQLYPPLDSLNQLGSIPWRVNKPVLDTVIEVFNSGGCDKLDIPEPPHASPAPPPVTASMNKQERYDAYRQRLLLRRHKAEMYSLWCDALYKLSLANHFRDRIFWLPHNMDFRGRVYPCPPHLNHLGADMSRSLLCFAQGKPLGTSGLDWLKIHLVNLLGTKKRDSIRDRLDHANSILSDILDSAENPLSGKKWWIESETPWQTLACCMEIRAALQHPKGPEHFISHFPIHQDGSCNGLQHYAALGRDEAGACSVNLMPQDLPQDVYSCVAALVERERAKDSAAGNKVAKELDGFVLRKVIKQTVMTTVYGVTRFGARLQIAKQLKDIPSFPKDCVWPASTYLVAKTFDSLREMFKSTKEIQDWFTECAGLVSQTCGQNMEYVTPLGLPVVQYYSRQAKKHDFTVTKLGQVQEFFPIDMFDRPNVMKQKNAFPPNFIHSLDSSHMMLTSIVSEQNGITFVSVHDCYWTHACTVPIMNQICREQFVALHSEPILENLSKCMLQKYGYDTSYGNVDKSSSLAEAKHRLNTVLAQVPPKGTFILENVLDSIYFFS